MVSYLLASYVQLHFEQKVTSVITMKWKKEWQENDNFECKEKLGKCPIRNSIRNKKMPFTKSKDFLWVN
jgi:hypothetical protein